MSHVVNCGFLRMTCSLDQNNDIQLIYSLLTFYLFCILSVQWHFQCLCVQFLTLNW